MLCKNRKKNQTEVKTVIPGITKKCLPKCVQSFISVYRQLIQEIHIGVLAIGLGVICTKDGWYNFINEKVKAIFVSDDFSSRRYEYQ